MMVITITAGQPSLVAIYTVRVGSPVGPWNINNGAPEIPVGTGKRPARLDAQFVQTERVVLLGPVYPLVGLGWAHLT